MKIHEAIKWLSQFRDHLIYHDSPYVGVIGTVLDEVGRLRAEVARLARERDEVIRMCVYREYPGSETYYAFAGDFRCVLSPSLIRAGDEAQAIAAVRKAAGLDGLEAPCSDAS